MQSSPVLVSAYFNFRVCHTHRDFVSPPITKRIFQSSFLCLPVGAMTAQVNQQVSCKKK